MRRVRDETVLTMVNNNSGSIGMVNTHSIHSHVEVLKVDKKLPMEQGARSVAIDPEE